MRSSSVAAVVVTLIPFASLARVDTFECVVTSVHAVSAIGELVTETDHLKKQAGSTFSVERATGAIRGGYFINNRHSAHVEVVNTPTENSYYVISKSHGPRKMVGYLYIANYRKWAQKPFTYTASGEYVYSGYCQ